MTRFRFLAVLTGMSLSVSVAAYGDEPIPILPAAAATIVPSGELPQSMLGSTSGNGHWSDVDKSNSGSGGWGLNYYDDVNNDGDHDPGEPFGDNIDSGWGNPKSAFDLSCWLASACNMLEQVGAIADADALYAEYALNGVGTLTWDDGGLQELAILQWMNEHPAFGLQMSVHWCSDTVSYTDGMFAWEDWDPRAGVDNYLTNGWEVGIGMWPLSTDGESYWHGGGHGLTMQQLYAGMTFDCTDSDRDADWSGPGDINTYNDATRGPTAFGGHNYYGWYNDFYDGNIDYYPAGDVGYVVAIIPEPGTLLLLVVGSMALAARLRK